MVKRAIPALVRHYAEAASFQWIMRERALRAPHFTREDLAALENRLEAQLDGLRVAGEAGWEICREELSWEEPGEVFTAAVLALETGDGARIQAVSEAAAAAPELSRALISALGWLPWEQAAPRVEALAASETPALRYAAVGGAAVHRRWIPALLSAALKDADPAVLARALKACGELGRPESLPALEAQRGSSDEACRFRAHWSSLLLGKADAQPGLLSIGGRPGPHRHKALSLALRAMPAAGALAWLDGLDEADALLRIQGLGWVGSPASVPWLLQQIRKPHLARQAGAAITWITGEEFLPGGLGQAPPPGLEEELEEAGLAAPTDLDLPWPDADKTEAWWREAGKKFAAGKAYALGLPKSAGAFREILAQGKQCHRLGAALELALLEPGKPLYECRAPARRQKTG